QACHDWYPRWTRWPNWALAEIAIGACDLAEVLGSAVALNLLFHIPMFWAVLVTACDVLLLLALRRFGMRLIEAVILVLVATIGVCYFLELVVLPATRPDLAAIGAALFHPALDRAGMTTLAIGIVGATVMPHNLYLHSALVQSRRIDTDDDAKRAAIRFNMFDCVAALVVAFLINAAILVLAALVYHDSAELTVAGVRYVFDAGTDWIRVAYLTLTPLLGAATASVVFAVALLASGQSSTITGTLARRAVAAPPDHAPRRYRPRDPADRLARRRQRHRSPGAEPGRAGAATAVRAVPAAPLHQPRQIHGALEERAAPARRRLERRDLDRGDGSIRPARRARRGVARRCRRVT